MKNARVGQADLSTWLPLAAAAAGLAVLMLAMMPASRAGKPADKRPDYSIGYHVHRTELPGYFPNRVTSRASWSRATAADGAPLVGQRIRGRINYINRSQRSTMP